MEVALDELPLEVNDVLLLCSDGLTRGVTPDEVLQEVRNGATPQAAAERLVDLANAAGGEDNTTVCVEYVLTFDRKQVLQEWTVKEWPPNLPLKARPPVPSLIGP